MQHSTRQAILDLGDDDTDWLISAIEFNIWMYFLVNLNIMYLLVRYSECDFEGPNYCLYSAFPVAFSLMFFS